MKIELSCLNGNDVISASVSDHHPIIHDGVLFWNVMMQARIRTGREGMSYNNGFGIVESEEDYINRLNKIAAVIAEIVHRYPTIEVISLCEGPVQPLHINALLQCLKNYYSMHKFFLNSTMADTFYKPTISGFPNWGLLMLADKSYKVNEIACDMAEYAMLFAKLANRFQLWEFVKHGKRRYLALGHFPFGGDEHTTKKENLSACGKIYCDLVKNLLAHYVNDEFILCADFNLNPYLIGEWNDRAMDRITTNNSIVLTNEEQASKSTIKTVTVDGILLSQQEKQKYSSLQFKVGLFGRSLERENNLLTSSIKAHLVENRHANDDTQKEYDKQFGLVPWYTRSVS